MKSKLNKVKRTQDREERDNIKVVGFIDSRFQWDKRIFGI